MRGGKEIAEIESVKVVVQKELLRTDYTLAREKMITIESKERL